MASQRPMAPEMTRVLSVAGAPSSTAESTRLQAGSSARATDELPTTYRVVASAAAPSVVRAGELGVALGTPVAVPFEDTWWRHGGVDHHTLRELIKGKRFRASHSFRVFIVELTLDTEQRRIVRERAFDWFGRSGFNHGWLVGSSVKILAAAAALVRTREFGFTPEAHAAFDGRVRREADIGVMVDAALIESDNIAYNRLIQLAGCDWLNESFLTPDNGFLDTGISEAYAQSKWRKLRMRSDLRFAPPIELSEEGLFERIPATRGQGRPRCGGAVCTNMQDIAEGMRRIALQEWLPPWERFGIHPDDLYRLHSDLAAPRERGENVVEGLRSAFGDVPLTILHKPGYADRWFTDVLYVHPDGSERAWVIVMTARRGRRGLDRAARVFGRILASGALEEAEHVVKPIGEDERW